MYRSKIPKSFPLAAISAVLPMMAGAADLDIPADAAFSPAFGIASYDKVTANGVLDVSAPGSGASIKSLYGSGEVRLGSNAMFIFNASAANPIFSGRIEGVGGSLFLAAGQHTLSGANTYSGGTTIDGPAALILAGQGGIADTRYAVVNGRLDLSATDNGGSIGSLLGKGQVVLGDKTLTITHAGSSIVPALATDTFLGVITGTGGLRVSGGSQALTGDDLQYGAPGVSGQHAYTGQTTIDAGASLALTGTASIAQSSGVADNGTFDISGGGGGASIKALSGNGSVALGANTLTVAGNSDGAFAGVISGAGGLAKEGGGALVLAGSNTYQGGTRLDAGILGAGSDTALGTGALAMAGGATLKASRDALTVNNAIGISGAGSIDTGNYTLTLAGAIGGSGSLAKTGLGTLNLTHANDYGGGTSLGSGTLGVGNNAALGAGALAMANGTTLKANGGVLTLGNAVGLSGAATVDTGNYTLTLGGPIGGAGGLSKEGAGTLILAGNNTYGGATHINAGTLQAGSANAIPITSAVTIGAGAALSLGGFTNTIGSLAGAGNATLENAILTVGTDNASTTFSGSLTGAGGTLVKTGAGALNLTGAVGGDAFTLLVQQGMVRVNGIVQGAVAVDAGAVMRGTGQIGGPVNVRGTLAPGNSPGILTVNSTVAMAPGGTLEIDVDGPTPGNGAGHYSQLIITGAGHQFIANGTLNVLFRGITGDANNNYVPNPTDHFTFIKAEGGIVGDFTNKVVTGLPDNATLKFYTLGNDYVSQPILQVVPESYALYLAGANANTVSAATAIDRIAAATPVITQNPLYAAIANLNGAQLAVKVNQMSGEVHGAMAAAAPEAGRWLQNSVFRQLSSTPNPFSAGQRGGGAGDPASLFSGNNLWFDFNVSSGHSESDHYSTSFTSSTYQFAIGVDLLHEGANRLGLGATYATTSVAPSYGSGTIEETAPFLYGQYVVGRAIFDAIGSYGFTTWKTDRMDPLQGGRLLAANGSGNSALFSAGVRSPWTFDGFTVEPFARVLWQYSQRGAVSEGTSLAALNVANYYADGTRFMIGAAIGSEKRDPLTAPYTYRASVAFGTDVGDLVRPSVTNSLAGQAFNITAPHVGREFAQVNLSGTYQLFQNAYGYVGVIGEARSNRLDGGVNAGFNIRF